MIFSEFWFFLKEVLEFCQNLRKFSEMLLNLLNLSEICKNKLVNFDKRWDYRAVQRSALCRSRRELSNAYLVAKFGLDTAENEPCQVWPSRAASRRRRRSRACWRSPRRCSRTRRCRGRRWPAASGAGSAWICHGMRQTLQGSFSAVSKPKFATKYAFESSRRDLHNALLRTALQSQFFVKICHLFR